MYKIETEFYAFLKAIRKEEAQKCPRFMIKILKLLFFLERRIAPKQHLKQEQLS